MLLTADDCATVPSGASDELERLGLVQAGGGVTPTGRALVEIMTEARLVISIECETADLPSRSTIWARQGSAVWGRPSAGEVFELRQIDPIEIPLLLAQLTDVGRRPTPPFAGAVIVDGEPLRAALNGEYDQEVAFGILVAAGVDPLWADRLLIAHEHRRMQWTVSSVWTDPAGGHGVHDVTVLDAGPAGYWHVRRGHGDESLKFTVGSLTTVMRSLRACVPAWCATPV